MKHIFCSIHGYIQISDLALKIINTPVFQRLRRIQQLGVAVYVFPNASHSRFEHSLGVYKLATDVISHLRRFYPYIVTESFEKCLTIAALVHDIGHLCYSHVSDDFIKNTASLVHLKTHEERSIYIFRKLVVLYELPFDELEQSMVENMIVPRSTLAWQYNILSSQYGFDIDRADYVIRDSRNSGITINTSVYTIQRIISSMQIQNNQLVYRTKCHQLIDDVIQSRTHLHKCIYQHRVSTAIEEMVFDIFRKSKSIDWRDIDQLDDNIIFRINGETDAEHIKNRIIQRKLYYAIDVDFSILQKKYSSKTITYKLIGVSKYTVRPLRKIGFGQHSFYRTTFILKQTSIIKKHTFKKAVKQWENSFKPLICKLVFI